MTKLLTTCLLSISLISLSSITTSAAVLYVSNGGSDSNAGTQKAPFATIQKAADVAEAGDTVKVLAGVYSPQNAAPYRGMIIFRRSGAPGKPIVFEATGDVRIKGDGGVAKFGGIFEINAERSNVTRIHDLVIRGFRLENSTWFGISLNRTENILLENNYTYNTGGSGIQASQSRNIIARKNTLERACSSPDKSMDTQEIISFSGVDGFEIERNHVFNGGIVNGGNGGEGIDAKTGSRNGTIHHNLVHDLIRLGIYVDSWDRTTEDIQIYSNTVFNCSDGIAISSENGGTVKRIKLFNNVLYNNRINGIVISSWVANGPREDIEIINNTVFHNGFQIDRKGAWGGGITIETTNVNNVVIGNNIVSQNRYWQILVNKKTDKLAIDHNLIDSFCDYIGDNHREEKGVNTVKGDPLFIDPRSGDFHLRTDSPAIDQGLNASAPDKDFDLTPRPQGKAVDIGAYEMSKK